MKVSDAQLSQDALALLPPSASRPKLVSIELISRIRSMREALRKCVDEGINDGHIVSADEAAAYLQIDSAQFSRILNNKGRNLDDDSLNRLERVCGNKIPTQWLAYQDGNELRQIESEVERENRQLKETIERMQQEQDAIARFLRHTKSEV